jgi:fumarate hydratase subunit alpha
MRKISVKSIGAALYDCIAKASFELGQDEIIALRQARQKETNSTAREILDQLLDNAEIARCELRPLCQDTGLAVVFVDIGQAVALIDGDLTEAINSAVAKAYTELYLRKSVVRHALDRQNTHDNTPAIIHTRIVPGDKVRLRFAAKGGGCENMSQLAILMPSAGRAGVVDFVVKTVRDALANPCPPIVVGVGLGGNFETVAIAAKEALLVPLSEPAGNALDAALEKELLEKINATGIGAMGLGGCVTALAVHVQSRPCHIASLPVAVNLDCHSHRHAEIVL